MTASDQLPRPPAGAPAATRLPNLVIVGVTKAGTTSLFSYLAQHPEICGSTCKETEYFSGLQYPDGQLGPLTAYARHFRHCRAQRYVMEATPNYWYGGPAVTAALEQVLAGPRYVISLRDPVERFWSDYTYMTSKALLPDGMGVDCFLDTCLEHRQAGTDFRREGRYFRTLSTGYYLDNLVRWLDTVGSRLRLVFFEDLVSDPVATVAGIVTWLGLDASGVPSFDFAERNQTMNVRNAKVQRIASEVNARARGLLVRFPKVREQVVRAYYAANRAGTRTGSLDPAVRRRLEELYRPANVGLGAELRRRGYGRLPTWLSAVA